jgi:hypothetical protein
MSSFIVFFSLANFIIVFPLEVSYWKFKMGFLQILYLLFPIIYIIFILSFIYLCQSNCLWFSFLNPRSSISCSYVLKLPIFAFQLFFDVRKWPASLKISFGYLLRYIWSSRFLSYLRWSCNIIDMSINSCFIS